MQKNIVENFRIKMIEPLEITTSEDRKVELNKAKNNIFLLPAQKCCIDLLTDSGTGALSTKQWAAMMLADESYAGSNSWFHFEKVVKNITGMSYIFPTHQGRAAESIFSSIVLKPHHVVPNNSHFDTTRANIEYAGAKAVDCLNTEQYSSREDRFKGNMDLDKLRICIKEYGVENIPFIMLTLTNNTGGGQPVSMQNIKEVRAIADDYKLPLVLDVCRFAENSYFIHLYETEYKDKSLLKIAQEIFSYADASIMSCKKDGLSNAGGFFTTTNKKWAEDFRNLLILREGFPSYGGLSGRELESIAVGLEEALDIEYQKYRHASMIYLEKHLCELGVPMITPVGGHGVFIDAQKFAEHIPAQFFPGISLVNSIYLEGGVRCVEIGSSMLGYKDANGVEHSATMELVRLASPRRVYTQSHFDYLIEVIEAVWAKRKSMLPYKMVWQAPFLRHFTAHYEVCK